MHPSRYANLLAVGIAFDVLVAIATFVFVITCCASLEKKIDDPATSPDAKFEEAPGGYYLVDNQVHPDMPFPATMVEATVNS